MGGRGMCPRLSSALGPHLVQAPGILPQALWVCRCATPTVSRRPYVLGVLHPFWLFRSFYLLFQSPLILEARDLMGTGLLGLNIPKSLTRKRIYQSQLLLSQSQLSYWSCFSIPKDFILSSNIKYQVKKGENKRGIEGEREERFGGGRKKIIKARSE